MARAPKGKTTRQRHVLDTLRGEIVAGVYPPGGRLPVQTELTARFGVGSSTVAQALAVLGREGFVTSRRGAGCSVCENPPHLRNIVVAVPRRRMTDSHWSNYYVSMMRVASDLQARSGRTIRFLEGLEDPLAGSHEDLDRMVRSQRVAGILFVNPPNLLAGTAILDQPGIPRVAVAATDITGVDVRVVLNGRFIEKAVAYLVERGRHNVALVSAISGWNDGHGEHMRGVLAAAGVHCPPYWQIPVDIDSPQTAQSVVRLLMRGREVPDALIVADDNLVDDAVAGLVAEGVRVPAGLEVVAHCNFPWPSVSALPVRRLGPDLARMVRESIAAIDGMRGGKPAPALLEYEAVWESERRP